MAMDCVCLPSGWNADDSFGRKPKAVRSHSRGRSYRCCLKASIGAGHCARTRQSCRYKKKTTEHARKDAHCDLCCPPRVQLCLAMTPFDVVLPDLDALDSEKLKALVIEKHVLVIEKATEVASQHDEIQRLKLFIAKLQRMQFGPSSERLAHHIDQLELQLEDLETTKTAKPTAVAPHAVPAAQPARKPLPTELPRATETLSPKETSCPDCGGTLKHLGEDVSEM